MLRKFAYNKIFRTTGMLLLFLLLLVFPISKKYSLDDTKIIHTIYEQKKIETFLIDKNNYISRTLVNIKYNDDIDLAKNKLELLIIDGKYNEKIPNGFKAILPSGLKINDVKIENDLVYIDLSKDFYDLKKEYEQKAIEAIVYNMTSINNISKVYLSIDGVNLNYLPKSKKNISLPLTRNIGINKEININTYKDVSYVTVYYISKNKNEYYYVPVTKVSNSKNEKIKIIIDELTSSKIYETNLMSFLNYNTKLIDYSINNDQFILNFNKYVFDDIENKDILEEVIYSICLSINDNYDVKEVIFNVDGKEILKSVTKNLE